MNKILILFLVVLTASCQANDMENSPYDVALKEGIEGKGTFIEIIGQDKQTKYESKIVEINGYIDHEYSRLYLSEDLYQLYLPGIDKSDNKISFSLDVNIKELDNYSCHDEMVRVEATYKYEETELKKRHHLIDIVKIYAYDTTPFHKGGTGGLIECYSAE